MCIFRHIYLHILPVSSNWSRQSGNSDVIGFEMYTGTSTVMDHPPPSPISQFYSGRSVLITGGTGVIGRTLIVKLLLSCPDVVAIYVLVRPNGGEQPAERCENVFGSLPMLRQASVNKKVSLH